MEIGFLRHQYVSLIGAVFISCTALIYKGNNLIINFLLRYEKLFPFANIATTKMPVSYSIFGI